MKRRGSYHRRRFTIFTRPWPTPATSCTIYKIVPELPDIVVYIQALDKRIQGQTRSNESKSPALFCFVR